MKRVLMILIIVAAIIAILFGVSDRLDRHARVTRWEAIESALRDRGIEPADRHHQLHVIAKPDAMAQFIPDSDESAGQTLFCSMSYISEKGVINIYFTEAATHSVQIVYRDPAEPGEVWLMFNAALFEEHAALAARE